MIKFLTHGILTIRLLLNEYLTPDMMFSLIVWAGLACWWRDRLLLVSLVYGIHHHPFLSFDVSGVCHDDVDSLRRWPLLVAQVSGTLLALKRVFLQHLLDGRLRPLTSLFVLVLRLLGAAGPICVLFSIVAGRKGLLAQPVLRLDDLLSRRLILRLHLGWLDKGRCLSDCRLGPRQGPLPMLLDRWCPGALRLLQRLDLPPLRQLLR